jgi:SAM-dependent methyltransferase
MEGDDRREPPVDEDGSHDLRRQPAVGDERVLEAGIVEGTRAVVLHDLALRVEELLDDRRGSEVDRSLVADGRSSGGKRLVCDWEEVVAGLLAKSAATGVRRHEQLLDDRLQAHWIEIIVRPPLAWSTDSWSDPMTEPESWQVSTEAAEVYESCFVPAIFGAWAGPVADAAGIGTADRVLDVGCGTGVLAREALERVGREGRVVGLDLNAGMLAVAARTEPRIEWRQGDAASLPFQDESFGVVVSQFALMYFPEPATALSEMWRTLAPGGRLAIAAWAPLGHARSYQILVDLASRLCGDEEAGVLAAPFVLGDRTELAKLFVDSGISGADVKLHEGSIRFPSVKEFIRIEVKGSPLADMVSDQAMASLAAESETALAEFVVPSGEICRWTRTS